MVTLSPCQTLQNVIPTQTCVPGCEYAKPNKYEDVFSSVSSTYLNQQKFVCNTPWCCCYGSQCKSIRTGCNAIKPPRTNNPTSREIQQFVTAAQEIKASA